MRYSILALLGLITVIAYVQRAGLSVPTADVRADLGLDEVQLGLVMGAWYAGYAVLQVPSGWLADRWGSRRALALYATAWSLLTGLAGLADDFTSLLIVWTGMGMAQAGIFPCATKAIGAWFPETRRAFASGLLACSMAGGGALAPALTAWLLRSFSWQQTLALYAVAGLLWAGGFVLLAFAFARVDPEARLAPGMQPPIDWGRIVRSVPMGLLCTQQFLRAAAMVFFVTWFPTFLRATRGVSQDEAGLLTAWTGVGAMLGGLLGGAASDTILQRTGNRRLSRQGVAVVGMTVCAVLIVLAYFTTDTRGAVLLISLGVFAGTFGGVSGYAVAIEFGGRRVATVFSLMNMCGNLGSALFPPAVSWLVLRTGRWDFVLFLFAGIFAADAVCWAFLNPRGTLFEEPAS